MIALLQKLHTYYGSFHDPNYHDVLYAHIPSTIDVDDDKPQATLYHQVWGTIMHYIVNCILCLRNMHDGIHTAYRFIIWALYTTALFVYQPPEHIFNTCYNLMLGLCKAVVYSACAPVILFIVIIDFSIWLIIILNIRLLSCCYLIMSQSTHTLENSLYIYLHAIAPSGIVVDKKYITGIENIETIIQAIQLDDQTIIIEPGKSHVFMTHIKELHTSQYYLLTNTTQQSTTYHILRYNQTQWELSHISDALNIYYFSAITPYDKEKITLHELHPVRLILLLTHMLTQNEESCNNKAILAILYDMIQSWDGTYGDILIKIIQHDAIRRVLYKHMVCGRKMLAYADALRTALDEIMHTPDIYGESLIDTIVRFNCPDVLCYLQQNFSWNIIHEDTYNASMDSTRKIQQKYLLDGLNGMLAFIDHYPLLAALQSLRIPYVLQKKSYLFQDEFNAALAYENSGGCRLLLQATIKNPEQYKLHITKKHLDTVLKNIQDHASPDNISVGEQLLQCLQYTKNPAVLFHLQQEKRALWENIAMLYEDPKTMPPHIHTLHTVLPVYTPEYNEASETDDITRSYGV